MRSTDYLAIRAKMKNQHTHNFENTPDCRAYFVLFRIARVCVIYWLQGSTFSAALAALLFQFGRWPFGKFAYAERQRAHMKAQLFNTSTCACTPGLTQTNRPRRVCRRPNHHPHRPVQKCRYTTLGGRKSRTVRLASGLLLVFFALAEGSIVVLQLYASLRRGSPSQGLRALEYRKT